MSTFIVAVGFLLLGDFLSTFLYHCPEHVFGGFHSKVHHGHNKSFLHYAVLTKNPLVLLDGFLGALPYLILVPALWQISPVGTLIGLALGQAHVIWRHTTSIGWVTSPYWLYVTDMLMVTTPERHWLHHKDARAAFGDIFTFYDAPAQAWMKFLKKVKVKFSKPSSIS